MSSLNSPKEMASPVREPKGQFSQLYSSPHWLVVIITIAVFATECMVMVLLSYLPRLPARAAVLLDSTILILFILPCLNFLVFRPLVLHITESRKREEELRDSRERLRKLSAHLQAVREEERTSIAREIHDELGQVLATLRLDAALVASGLNGDQALLAEKVRSMAQLIEGTVRTVQRISSELRPVMLDDLGLAEAMDWQAKDFVKRTGIPCEIAISLGRRSMDREVSTAVYRIFQEALTNVMRHSDAKKVEASLVEKRGSLELVIQDDGRGITRDEIGNPLSLGLVGMRERVVMLGGRIRICGSPRRGTMLAVRVPVAPEEGGP